MNNNELSESFMDQVLSESFIEKHLDNMNFMFVLMDQVLSESFIEKHLDNDNMNWYCVSFFQKLSDTFIEKYQDEVDWSSILKSQKLSEDFIERHVDKINWSCVSKFQKLSEDFIERHVDKINWFNITMYQKLSDSFIKKYHLKIPKNSWLYKNKEFKRATLLDTKLYELEGDRVYAYKAVRKNYYSLFNFQYLYEIGKVYESHADYNPENEDSFGLSVWTYEKAKEYYDRGRILKVRIHLDDVACLVHQENKLRCSKIEIIDEM